MEKPDCNADVQRDGPANCGKIQAVASVNENGEASADSQDELQVVGDKARLRRRKTASKATMTTRIHRVREIIEANGSRAKVKYFRMALLEGHEDQKSIGKEIERGGIRGRTYLGKDGTRQNERSDK